MGTSLQNRIRERAYHQRRGQVHGQAEQHWLAAEREILAQMTAETPAGYATQKCPSTAASHKRVAAAKENG
jgi:hypothetical protein